MDTFQSNIQLTLKRVMYSHMQPRSAHFICWA